jgi:hypothetical protein
MHSGHDRRLSLLLFSLEKENYSKEMYLLARRIFYFLMPEPPHIKAIPYVCL